MHISPVFQNHLTEKFFNEPEMKSWKHSPKRIASFLETKSRTKFLTFLLANYLKQHQVLLRIDIRSFPIELRLHATHDDHLLAMQYRV